jgi:hypothetical protein
MNKRFPVLSIISILIRIFGWLVLIGGLFVAIYQGIIEPNLEGHSFGNRDLYELVAGISAFLIGIILIALGELVGVLFAIEGNTRKIAES